MSSHLSLSTEGYLKSVVASKECELYKGRHCQVAMSVHAAVMTLQKLTRAVGETPRCLTQYILLLAHISAIRAHLRNATWHCNKCAACRSSRGVFRYHLSQNASLQSAFRAFRCFPCLSSQPRPAFLVYCSLSSKATMQLYCLSLV